MPFPDTPGNVLLHSDLYAIEPEALVVGDLDQCRYAAHGCLLIVLGILHGIFPVIYSEGQVQKNSARIIADQNVAGCYAGEQSSVSRECCILRACDDKGMLHNHRSRVIQRIGSSAVEVPSRLPVQKIENQSGGLNPPAMIWRLLPE